ncbi:MAG: TlpA family protein disulfide reductase [Flavobacteriaceae bacterium]|nr:TlpA family protein disulfide reductase [Flavobacteriaceae bacterium]
MIFWKYTYKYTQLSADFIGLDTEMNEIPKKTFLNKLLTGNYLTMRLSSKSNIYYQLYKVDKWVNKSIQNTIKNITKDELHHYNMEGKQFPEFDITDLEGNRYNNEKIKGKTLVLKTWFIKCGACIKEIPDLNKLVSKYSYRDDIIFLSMAEDKNIKLKSFLEKTKFRYATAGEQKDFIINKLKLDTYPTHIIINKEGTIVKVVNTYKELKIALEKELSK